MESISQTTEASKAVYELLMSYKFVSANGRRTRRYFIKSGQSSRVELLIKDFLPNEKTQLKTTDTEDGVIICCGEENISNRASFVQSVWENLADFLKIKTDHHNSITEINTYGIMSKFHNHIVGEAGLDFFHHWRETEFSFIKKYYIGRWARILVKMETPYYFSAEYLSVFTGAKFDYFAEDSDIYKGEESRTIREVFEACNSYFRNLQSESAKDFFNGITDSGNPLDSEIVNKNLIGKMAVDSFAKMYQECVTEKKNWTKIADERGFLKNI